jgi:acyl carrier protein
MSTAVETTPVCIAAMEELLAQLKPDETERVTLSPDTRFVMDLGLSSMQLIGLVYLCEQTFKVSLVSQRGLLQRLNTVGQAVAAIGALQRGAPALEAVAS